MRLAVEAAGMIIFESHVYIYTERRMIDTDAFCPILKFCIIV